MERVAELEHALDRVGQKDKSLEKNNNELYGKNKNLLSEIDKLKKELAKYREFRADTTEHELKVETKEFE